MHTHLKFLKLAALLIIILIALAFTWNLKPSTIADPDPAIRVTAQTNKDTYLLRQKVSIEGNITEDGQPTTNLVVAIRIVNSKGTRFAYRTLTIGSPTQTWPISITEIFLEDLNSNPINTAKIGNLVRVSMTIYNTQATARAIFATLTVFDANMVPIQVGSWNGTVGPLETYTLTREVYIENWACPGKALIAGNVYSKEPNEGGLVLSPEKTTWFCISRVQQGQFEYPTLPPPPPQTTPGIFFTELGLPPDPIAGTYQVFVKGQASPAVIYSTETTFTVENSAGYPPTASFAYWPAQPYENQTINFDASSSTPEGFNDTITKYQWDFGDGTPKITETDPYITYKYLNANTYIVTLNVTDNENLWSITQKPITILPEFGPTANFTWTPDVLIINETATFNASGSTPGWSKTQGAYSPIVSYTWNFSDGTGNITVTTPTIDHNFTQPGNYTVTLTIADAVNRKATTTALIEVLNKTYKDYDFNGDGIIDMKDIRRVSKAFGSQPGDPNWDPVVDINHDNFIDMKDVRAVAKNFGKDP